jgi:hypothetical protein
MPNVFVVTVIINGYYDIIVLYSVEECNLIISKQDYDVDTSDFD